MWTPAYFVRYTSLPSSVRGVTLPNDDGSFDIYINSVLGEEIQERTLRHEVKHIKLNHFYGEQDVLTDEKEAEGVVSPVPTPAAATVRMYFSLEHLKRYYLQTLEGQEAASD